MNQKLKKAIDAGDVDLVRSVLVDDPAKASLLISWGPLLCRCKTEPLHYLSYGDLAAPRPVSERVGRDVDVRSRTFHGHVLTELAHSSTPHALREENPPNSNLNKPAGPKK